MKKVIAFALCFITLLACACQKEGNDNGTEDTTLPGGGGSDAAGGLLDSESDESSAEGAQGSETTASTEGSIPMPEALKIIQKNSTLKQDITQLGSDARVTYSVASDYISVLEAAGVTSSVEYWNDGIRHVKAVKDNILIQIDFIHDQRDDIFDSMIAGGEEVLGRLEVYIYEDKAV